MAGPTREHLHWPFFDATHRAFAEKLDGFAAGALAHVDHHDVDKACRALVRSLGQAGLLDAAVAGAAPDAPSIDSRLVCLARETLAWHDGLGDFAFAMQGLGTGAIALSGSPELRAAVLPKVRTGEWLAAFALSEKDAGSDVAAMRCAARADGDSYVLDGEKTWISNGGIADFYVVFAKSEEGISAFVVDADQVDASQRIDIVAPHPMATLKLRKAKGVLIGEAGQGFKLAMRNLDIFRTTVAGAALGFARRALDEAMARAKDRKMFGQTLADFQMTQAKLADMATGIDAAALLTYRAAWERSTKNAAMAKMFATETAQRVIDEAVQICGGLGVMRGHPVERLYREVRALRIYEGATEVQKLIIARELLKQ
jgi:acyl-CoA dehydrogenase